MDRLARHQNVLYLGLQGRRTQYAIRKSKFVKAVQEASEMAR
jgi:hypothetical protein